VTRIAGNIVLSLLFCGEACRLLLLSENSQLINAGLSITLALVAWFIVLRPPPAASDRGWGAALAVIAAAWPLIFYDVLPEFGVISLPAYAILLCSIALNLASLVSLQSNFSVVPEYRTLVKTGPYSIVRHPIYASYLIFDGVMALEALSLLAAVFWLIEFALFFARASFEEALILREDIDYDDYRRRVRHFFIPLLV
jgi:protein-S-isoprenylcysteine O-methyltransferase Ste14